MRILFFTDNFFPESNAPANRTFEHAKVWVKQGHEVIVITSFPNFPKGKVFPNYKNTFRGVENIQGIKVIRIWTYMAANQAFLKRTIDFLSFGIHAFIQGFFVASPDVIVGTSPQPFTVFAARAVAFFRRIPFVFEIRDLWPDSIVAVSALKESFMLKVFKSCMQRMYEKASKIVVVTDAFKDDLVCSGVDAKKIEIVKNGVDLDAFMTLSNKRDLYEQYGLPKEKFYVGYVGTIGMAHAIEVIVEAANLMKSYDDIHFVIMGDGAQRQQVEQLIDKYSLQNVSLLAAGDRVNAINVQSMLDVAIVHLKKDPLFEKVIPSKIFEAMALKKPIIIGVDGECRKIIEQANCGYYFEPENPNQLVEKILMLYNSKYQCHIDGMRGFQFVNSHFERSKLALKMLKVFEEVTD